MFITAWSAVVKAQAPIANREKSAGTFSRCQRAGHREARRLSSTRLFPLAEVDITALAKYTYETLGKRRAAVAYINNETGIDAAKLYKATFEKAGGQIVRLEAYDPKATEFSGMLLKLRAANPDMVHVHGLLVDTPLVIAQMRQLGLTAARLLLFRRLQSEAARPARSGGGRLHRHLAGTGRDRQQEPAGFLERWKPRSRTAAERAALSAVPV